MQPDTKFFHLGRNPSYASSVKTGLRFGLWLAPTTLLQAIGAPLHGAGVALVKLVYSLTMLMLRVIAWIVLSLALIVGGATGFVVPNAINQD